MACWVNSDRVSPMQEPLLPILNPPLKGLIPSITEVESRIFTIAETVIGSFLSFLLLG